MKEVEQVSIGGYAFTLEKDASQEVGRYLKDLEAHYLGQQGGKEIMEGIEERMAELLVERCGGDRVVTVADIRAVIDILGRPERIEADDPETEAPKEKTQRKMYRDLENKRIAGVCAGLASYFDADVVLFRVVFAVVTAILFFSGASHGVWSLTGFAVYAILWLAMPPARTAQERWAMKGDAGTLEDVRRNVRSGVQEMGDAARRGIREVEDAARSASGKELGKILLVAIGVILLLSGVSGLASVSVIGLKAPTWFSAPIDRALGELAENAPALYDLVSTPWVMGLAIAAVLLPLIGLIYGGIQMIFGFRPPSWKPGLVIFVLWLVVLVVLGVLFFVGSWPANHLDIHLTV